jgi:hypothetical protein
MPSNIDGNIPHIRKKLGPSALSSYYSDSEQKRYNDPANSIV